MIYKCEDCLNKNNCVENKEQYTTLCKVVESVLKLDKEPEFRSWFSVNMRCDYFILQEVPENNTCDCM